MDLAFVLVAEPAYPDPLAVVAAAEELGLALELQRFDDGPMVFSHGGASVMYMLIPAPHPDVPHMPRGITTPSPEELATAQAHFVVTIVGLLGEREELDLTLLAATAALVQTTPAVAAMFGHGVTFHHAGFFADGAAHAAKSGELMPELLIDVTAAPEEGDRMSFLTHGMVRYGREEIFVTCPVQGRGALDLVLDMVRWLLSDKEKQLPTGETVGRSPDEKLVIQRVPSPTGQGPDVVKLEL